MHTQQSLQRGCFLCHTAVFVLVLDVTIVIPHVRCVCVVGSIGVPRRCRLLLNVGMRKNYSEKIIRDKFAWARLACRDAYCRDFAHLWPGETWCLDPANCVANRLWPAVFGFMARQACVGQLCVTMSALACMDLADMQCASTRIRFACTRVRPHLRWTTLHHNIARRRFCCIAL
jgi:hypothetical protein